MRKLLTPAAILLFVTLLHPACDKVRKKQGVPNPTDKVYTVSVTKVQSKEIPDVIEIKGVFTPVQRVVMKSEFSGRIQALAVIEGQNVVTGDALLKIEDEKLPFILDRQRAEQREAEAQLELDSRLGGIPLPGEIPEDEVNGDEEGIEPGGFPGLNEAPPAPVEGEDQVLASPPASPSDAAPDQILSDQVDENVADEDKSLSVLRNRFRANRLARRTAAQNPGITRPPSTQDNPEINESRTNLVQARIDRIKAEVALTEKYLAGSTLASPIDGFVVKVSVNEGGLVNPNDVLIEIVEVNPIELTVKIAKDQIDRLEKSSEVKVSVDDLPGQIFKGEVTYIAPELDSDKKRIEVRIRVANPNQKIKVGMEGTAEIAIANKTHQALLVPTETILRKGDKREVYVIDGNLAVKQEVALGAFFENLVEIKSGLKATDQVVTKGLSSLKEDEEFVKISP